jgi:Na+-transporting NADH:ubiquinone oxidoreductase subunit C
MNTIYGVTFDHAGETPGLGSQINTAYYQQQFQNKRIFDESNRFVSISVEKMGIYHTPNIHRVDAISGGTITSNKLETMIRNGLEPYLNFFLQNK